MNANVMNEYIRIRWTKRVKNNSAIQIQNGAVWWWWYERPLLVWVFKELDSRYDIIKKKKKLFISIFLYNLCVYYVVACSIKTGKMLIYAVGLRNYVDYANLWFSNPSNIRPSQKMCLQLTVYSCYWGKIRENSVIDSFVLT